MATTTPGSPYVESSDLVANYPAVSEALAERVDTVGILPFADSTARGTALPTPTDGQYSYLQDTNTTEYWNGSAWVSAGATPGLVHIYTTTFSAVASVSLDNVFTSDYDNYKVIINITSTGGSGVFYMRMRAVGTDNTTTDYAFTVNNVVYSNGAESNYDSDPAFSRFILGPQDSGESSMYIYDIVGPALTYKTAYALQAVKDDR